MSTIIKGGSEKREGTSRIRSSGGMAILEETYSFIVVATIPNENRLTVLSTPGLPQVNQSLSASGYCICRSVDAQRWPDNPYYWTVTCEFSSEVEENQSGNNPASDPLVWVPVYETKFERLQEVVTKDKSGTSIANSAGQPFETGLTIPRFIPLWELYQFEPATLSDEQIIERNETVNSTAFKGRAAKTLLLTVSQSSIGFYYGRRMRLTKYTIRYNSKKWTQKRLDVGTVYKSGSDLLPYTDKNGNVILGALDGSGAKQAVGTPPAVLEFDQYEEKRFQDFLRI